MKNLKIKVLLPILLLINYLSVAQNTYLSIQTDNILNSKLYTFNSAKLMQNFVNDTITKIEKKGYINLEYQLIKKDSVFNLTINRNSKIEIIKVQNVINDENIDEITNKIEREFRFEDLNNQIKNITNYLEKHGFGFAKIQLNNHEIVEDTLYVDYLIESEKKRYLNDIIIVGYDKFPNGIIKDIKRKFIGKTFSSNTNEKISDYLKHLNFISNNKENEVLFEKEKTVLYIYVEKNKINKFDGYVGFGTNEASKLVFNGYLDLQLNNSINKGEKTNIIWNSTANKQSTFNFSTEIPYVFKTPIGINLELNNFKQDSTFQSTQTKIGIGYYKNYNTRIFLKKINSTSTYTAHNIQNYSNYKSNFYTLNFIKEIPDNLYSTLFKNQTYINITIGVGKRVSQVIENQKILESQFHYTFYLNSKNGLNIKNITYYLESNLYLNNELYRIGGINTLRGFNENTLQGNFINSSLIEYRYIINNQIYFHTITDFAIIKAPLLNTTTKAYSLGLGFGLFTKNGLFKLNYANGNTSKNNFNIKNSLFHLSLNTNF